MLTLVSRCGEDEKFLLAYVIFKLRLIQGKCIIFVADIDRSYRLKLFFEQFGIRSCILNSELPVNSRIHIVEEFNKNVYDIIIASDEKSEMLNVDAEDEDEENPTPIDKKSGEGKRPQKKRKMDKRDSEYGVSRGMLDSPPLLRPFPVCPRFQYTDTRHRDRFQECLHRHQL